MTYFPPSHIILQAAWPGQWPKQQTHMCEGAQTFAQHMATNEDRGPTVEIRPNESHEHGP